MDENSFRFSINFDLHTDEESKSELIERIGISLNKICKFF